MVKKIGRWMEGLFAMIGLFAVIVVTIPISDYLARPLRLKAQLRPAEAIVVLGGGAFKDGLPSISSLVRAVYGFSLFRAGYAPRILLAGGRPSPERGWEGLAMKKLLVDIGASPKLLETEDRSTRTYSNAKESARILQTQGATHVLLVTHPNHMLRAKWTFEKAGFTVYPAPVPWDRLPVKRIKPEFHRLTLFYSVLYEYGGLVLYWWRGWL
ncbi:MAG: YdcF family protein [Thermodesulfobacteriota bacterium]